MDLQILNQINSDIENALGFQDGYDKFKALSDIAKETDSSSLPIEIKIRVFDRIEEQQLKIVGLLDIQEHILEEIETISFEKYEGN